MKADLHIHTFFSDGLASPEEIVEWAVKGGLDVIAITDHDTFSGSRRAKEISQNKVIILTGVELSTFLDNNEIHILGYFPSDVPEAVEKFALESQRARTERVKEGLRNLEEIGIKIDIREVEKHVRGDVVTRNHIAKALVDAKKVSSVGAAFGKYLNYERGLVPFLPVTTKSAIEVIRMGGGKAVWAHPDFNVFDNQVENLISMGLEGVEVSRKRMEGVYTYYLERVSEDFNLLKTGGSDFHGYERNFKIGDFFVKEEKIKKFLNVMGIKEI